MCGFPAIILLIKQAIYRIHDLEGNGERVWIVTVIKSRKSVVSWWNRVVSQYIAKPWTRNTNE
jgi:hypothetical protein